MLFVKFLHHLPYIFIFSVHPAVPAVSCKQGAVGAGPTSRRGTRNKKTKSKRAKQMESSDSTASRHTQQQLRPPLLNPTSWSHSDTSQSTFPLAYPAVMPGYPLHVHPRASSLAPCNDTSLTGIGGNQGAQAPPCPSPVHPAPYTSPMVTPIVALVLPNYMYPPQPHYPPVYQAETAGFPIQTQPFGQSVFPGQATFTAASSFTVPNQFNCQNHLATQSSYVTPSLYFPSPSETPKAPVEAQSRSSTPPSGGGREQATPPLFQSRCSSPLNLLELELSVERQDSAALSSAGQGTNPADREKGASGNQSKERELKQVKKEINPVFVLSSLLIHITGLLHLKPS